MKMLIHIIITIVVYIAFLSIAMAIDFNPIWYFWMGWIANVAYEIVMALIKIAYKN